MKQLRGLYAQMFFTFRTTLILNKKAQIKRILKHMSMQFQGYLPFKNEETNVSSTKQSIVQYMVLAVFGG